MLYICVLVSAIHQYESAIGIHMSLLSCTSLPPTPSHPSWLSQSIGLSPASYGRFPPAIYFTYHDGWHHQLNGHEFEQAPGVGDGEGSLACCSPWGHKELDMTEQLNWMHMFPFYSSHSFHPPLYPGAHSLCLRIHCCPANRFISTIFLYSIYMG